MACAMVIWHREVSLWTEKEIESYYVCYVYTPVPKMMQMLPILNKRQK